MVTEHLTPQEREAQAINLAPVDAALALAAKLEQVSQLARARGIPEDERRFFEKFVGEMEKWIRGEPFPNPATASVAVTSEGDDLDDDERDEYPFMDEVGPRLHYLGEQTYGRDDLEDDPAKRDAIEGHVAALEVLFA